jgi:transcriptional regulator with XRE-family HTH domain
MDENEQYSKLGKELNDFRSRNKLSQTEIGKELGISQIQVSRIERGEAHLASNLVSKIQKLLKKPIIEYHFETKVVEDKMWRYAYHVYPEKFSGDSVIIESKSLADKTVIFHSDAVGNDVTAGLSAEIINLSAQAVISMLNIGCSSESIYYKFNRMLKGMKSKFRGDPSINIMLASQNFPKIEFINGGMPDIYLYRQKESNLDKLSNQRSPAVGLLPSKEFVCSMSVNLQKGDALFSFSDGFIDFFKEQSSTPLDLFLVTIVSAYKGEAQSIGNRLAKHLTDSAKNRTISDDLSFLTISRK